MAGAIVLVVVMVLMVPLLLGTASLAAFVLGWSLTDDAEARHEGSDLIDLNR